MVEAPSLTQVGIYLIGAGVVLALFGGFGSLDVLGELAGTFIFFGIVAVIIAAFRGGGGSQQQQQQVVVVQNGGEAGARGGEQHEEAAVRCPECERLNPVHASFCGQCGRSLGKTAQA